PVVAAFVPTTSDARLDHRVDRIRLSDLVGRERPPASHPLGENAPGHLRRRLHAHDLAHAVGIDTRGRLFGHRFRSLPPSRSPPSNCVRGAPTKRRGPGGGALGGPPLEGRGPPAPPPRDPGRGPPSPDP